MQPISPSDQITVSHLERYTEKNDTWQQVLKCANSLAVYCDSAHGLIGDGFSSWKSVFECQILMEPAQLMASGEEKCVKLVGWGMSANHDIKSRPPAAHFATILCTKSQHCRFVAASNQLPHLKKSKVWRLGRGREQSFWLREVVVYCFFYRSNWETA